MLIKDKGEFKFGLGIFEEEDELFQVEEDRKTALETT